MTTNEDLLFVELALKRDLVTQEQVDEILEVQKKLEEMGLTESVASLMVRKEVVSASDAEAVRAKVSPKGGRQQIKGYRLIERLGRGGMGSVYKAVQISMGRTVALKILKPSLAQDDQSTSRLRREAQLVGKLRHKNIVQGLDFGVSNGFHYFAMEYVEGESIKEMVERGGALKEKDALAIITQIAEALNHAHEEGVVHRDVKPGNILITKDGTAMLADYGLAKGPLEDAELTRSGVTVGTPQYISPEQAKGPSDVDIRTDLYSLGATLYHMLTGRPPYEGDTLAHLIQQVLYEPYAPVRSLRRDVSPNVAFLVDKLMARKPAHRYQNPKDLLKALKAIEDGKSIVPAGWVGSFEIYHRSRRSRRVFALAIVLALVAAGASVFTVLHMRDARIQRHEDEAAEALMLWLEQVRPETYGIAIPGLEEWLGKYSDTKSAEAAREALDHLRKQQKELNDASDAGQRIGRLADRGEFADAKRLIREFLKSKEGVEGEGAEYARQQIRKAETTLDERRDALVGKAIKDARKQLADETPRKALDELTRLVDSLRSKAYVEDEEPDALAAGEDLRRNLKRAIDGADHYLGPAKEVLEKSEYKKALTILNHDEREYKDSTELTAALDRIEPNWRYQLDGGFTDLRRQIASRNQKEWATSQSKVRQMVTERQSYQAAIADLNDIAGRSIQDIAVEIKEMQDSLTEILDELKTEALSEWDLTMPRFFNYMGQRNWVAAQNELDGLKQRVLTHQPNEYQTAIQGAQETLSLAIAVEEKVLGELDGKKEAELTFGTIRERLHDLVVTERTISCAREPGGERQSRHVRDLAVSDLLKYFGFEEGDIQVGFLRAVLRLGEVQRMTDPAAADKEITRIEGWIGEARNFGTFGAFAARSLSYVRTVQAEIQQRLQSDEDWAERVYKEADEALRLNNWKEAYEKLSLLLENRKLRETKFVQDRLTTIRSALEEAKKNLPGAKVGEYFRVPALYLAGGPSVNRANYRMTLSFDFGDPEELSRWKYTRGRVDLIEEETPVAGPNLPDAMSREQLVAFLPPEKLPEDWLKLHPLRLESPFLYSRDLKIRFRARWKEPIALIVSLCGTNVVVLSDNGRRENGRGVHIWQAEDISRPDRVVPDVLRKTYLDLNPDVLSGDAKNRRYFQFEGNRWYSIGFTKKERMATLLVNGRTVYEKEILPRGARGREIVILTYSPCEIDEVRIEGTVDPQWYHRRVK